tara:strand:+ start:10832 stop:12673 length:1842 start_codon:yes stop_codon:yes gene_type:complete
MTKLCFLKKFDIKYIDKIDEKSIIFPLDYQTVDVLEKRKINYKIIDNYLSEEDRKELFLKCRKIWEELSKKVDDRLKIENVNVFRIIDRNEILEYLMEVYSEMILMKIVIEENLPNEILAPKKILDTIRELKTGIKLTEIYDDKEHELSFDYVNIRKKIGIIEINSKISRKKFKKIKKILGSFNKILIGKNQLDEKNKILLLEFDPELYENLLKKINQCGYTPVLLNFRKPAISSNNSLNIIKKTNSIVFSNDILQINEKLLSEKTKHKSTEIIQHIENNESFSEFDFFDVSLSKVIKNQVIKILKERLEEYFWQIESCKFLDKREDVVAGLSLNLSGETEVIFSKIKKNTELILLQHGFSNYYDFNQYSDTLDDYDLIQDKIAVWGNPVKEYLIKNGICPSENIILSGSPRHENYIPNEVKKIDKKTIVITPRPLIKHVEGIKLELQLRYELILKELILMFKNRKDVEIIFKLHPQQNFHNDVIKSTITKFNPKIQILQDESINEVLKKANFLINISPDNLDASTVVFESMLQEIPIINIKLQKNTWIYDFEKMNAVKSFEFDSNFKDGILQIIDNPDLQNSQINNIRKFLEFYFYNKKSASENLVNFISKN